MTEPNVIPLSERYRVKPPEPKEADERGAEIVMFPTPYVEDSRDLLPPCDIG